VSLQYHRLNVEFNVGMTRKLENICQGLALPAEQGEIKRFLDNTENVQRINSLVENVHEALMGYQVCMATTHHLPHLTFM